MSTWPGGDLEDFLAWNYDVVVDDNAEVNPSLSIAEAIGRREPRPRLTAEQFKPVVAVFEEFRESMEHALNEYDEDRYGSWRDYSSEVFARAPDAKFEEGGRVLNEVLGRKKPEDWLKEPEFSGYTIMDPDGWRGKRALSFEFPITKEDFKSRLMVSTCLIQRAPA